MKNFPLGVSEGAAPNTVNLGPLISHNLLQLKFLLTLKYSFRVIKEFSAKGHLRGAAPLV